MTIATPFEPFTLYIFDRHAMHVVERQVIKATESRYYLENPVAMSRGDKGGSAWLYTGLSPDGTVFDTGPTALGSRGWQIAYNRNHAKLVGDIRDRQTSEIATAAAQLKLDQMWLAGFKAMYP